MNRRYTGRNNTYQTSETEASQKLKIEKLKQKFGISLDSLQLEYVQTSDGIQSYEIIKNPQKKFFYCTLMQDWYGDRKVIQKLRETNKVVETAEEKRWKISVTQKLPDISSGSLCTN